MHWSKSWYLLKSQNCTDFWWGMGLVQIYQVEMNTSIKSNKETKCSETVATALVLLMIWLDVVVFLLRWDSSQGQVIVSGFLPIMRWDHHFQYKHPWENNQKLLWTASLTTKAYLAMGAAIPWPMAPRPPPSFQPMRCSSWNPRLSPPNFDSWCSLVSIFSPLDSAWAHGQW